MTICATTRPTRIQDRVQRGFHYAIVDEVDNILIDEARTPLIISGPATAPTDEYYILASVVKPVDARGLRDRRANAEHHADRCRL